MLFSDYSKQYLFCVSHSSKVKESPFSFETNQPLFKSLCFMFHLKGVFTLNRTCATPF